MWESITILLESNSIIFFQRTFSPAPYDLEYRILSFCVHLGVNYIFLIDIELLDWYYLHSHFWMSIKIMHFDIINVYKYFILFKQNAYEFQIGTFYIGKIGKIFLLIFI